MKILLSPAKTMNTNAPNAYKEPVFMHEATQLRKALRSMSLKKTETFFNVSKDVAKTTKQYAEDDARYEAISLFSGIAFKTFHEQSPNPTYDHLYILSGLYGLVHAKDGIYPYRLDLVHPTRGSLIHYWKKRLYALLKDEKDIISCASKEYEAILDERLHVTRLHITKDLKRAPSVDAKKVRGAFAHHLLVRQSPEGFSFDGYTYIKKDDLIIYIAK